jgi:hypothetical protein
VAALLRAAPLLCAFDVDVSQAVPAVACRLLRNEPPFGPLRVHELAVVAPWLGGEADVHALAADLRASASSLSQLVLFFAPLGTQGALDAVVDAALACRLPALVLAGSSLSAASVPALVRLLGGGALKTLLLHHNRAGPLLLSGAEGSAALLAAALRANSTLTELGLTCAHMWHDVAAGETLLQVLTAHATMQSLRLEGNSVRAADRARVGASLGALVAANAPALETLDVSNSLLGDEGLGPLVDALAGNTHLRVMDCSRNSLSDTFILHRLLPAFRANTSLQQLMLVGKDGVGSSPGLCHPWSSWWRSAPPRGSPVAAAAVAVQLPRREAGSVVAARWELYV